MDGENFVCLKGKLTKKQIKEVGANNSKLFNGSIAIPVVGYKNKFQYIKVAAWYSVAEALYELGSGVFIKIHGHIEEKSYNDKCRYCNGPQKKYWTEVIIDNFIKMEVDSD